jgi:hypothetical protein
VQNHPERELKSSRSSRSQSQERRDAAAEADGEPHQVLAATSVRPRLDDRLQRWGQMSDVLVGQVSREVVEFDPSAFAHESLQPFGRPGRVVRQQQHDQTLG